MASVKELLRIGQNQNSPSFEKVLKKTPLFNSPQRVHGESGQNAHSPFPFTLQKMASVKELLRIGQNQNSPSFEKS
jgi:hypothetical protein